MYRSNAYKVNLSIAKELQKIKQLTSRLEGDLKKLISNRDKGERLLKEASNILVPMDNFSETMIEATLQELKQAGLTNSDEYRGLNSVYDQIQRVNAGVRRMGRDASRAIN